MVPRRVPHRRRVDRARLPLDDGTGGGRVTDWWRKPRKWYIPLTYGPKIAGVLDGTIRQTLQCPKLTTRPGSAQSIQEAIISDLN